MSWDSLKSTATQRRALGTPPAPSSTIDNLAQPEAIDVRVDGRTLRAKGRTAQLNLHVRPEFKARFKLAAVTLGLEMADLIERALDAFDRDQAQHQK